jgi:hypothetical protein
MNDNMVDAIAHEQRRTLLLDLLESNPQGAGVESLPGESASTDAEHRLQIEMYHVHLPKLDDYGYIEWDKDAHEVAKGPRFDELLPLLDCVVNTRDDGQPERPVQAMTTGDPDTDSDLLTTALERGYFKAPRQTSLVDLADEHDMSNAEASQRLRTEIDGVLHEYLAESDATVDTNEE